MGRTIDYLERVSDGFDHLTADEQSDMVAELYTRLDAQHAAEAMRLMQFWLGRQKRDGNGTA